MIIDNISDKDFEGLKVEKLLKTDTCETILIRIQRGYTLPKHSTPKQALLVMQQGEAVFEIWDKQFNLKAGDHFIIPVNIEHTVIANIDSSLLIIR